MSRLSIRHSQRWPVRVSSICRGFLGLGLEGWRFLLRASRCGPSFSWAVVDEVHGRLGVRSSCSRRASDFHRDLGTALSAPPDGDFPAPLCEVCQRAAAIVAASSSYRVGVGLGVYLFFAVEIFIEPLCVDVAANEIIFGDYAAEEFDIRANAEKTGFAERAFEPGDGFAAIRAPGDQLREQRIVFAGHGPARVDAAIQRIPGPDGAMQSRIFPGDGKN